MAIVTTDHMARGEDLRTEVAGVERLDGLQLREERPLVVFTVTVLAGGLVAIRVVGVTVHPLLADGVHSVGSTVQGYGHGIVTHSALANHTL